MNPTLPDLETWLGKPPAHVLHIQNPNVFPGLKEVDLSTRLSVEDFTHGLVAEQGYDIAWMNDGVDPVILWNDDLESLQIVGGWIDNTLCVHENHRGHGLGKTLVLAKVVMNGNHALPEGVEWTPQGWTCAQSAYQLLVDWRERNAQYDAENEQEFRTHGNEGLQVSPKF